MGNPSDRHGSLKQTWLRTLRAGIGTAVIAAAVVGVPEAGGAVAPGPTDITARVAAARAAIQPDAGSAHRGGAGGDRLAWWGNRAVIVRPAWPNWPNWHNWPNWGNFGPGWPNY